MQGVVVVEFCTLTLGSANLDLHSRVGSSNLRCESFRQTKEGSGTKEQMSRVGQNHIYTVYTVYIQYFLAGNHQIYGVNIYIYSAHIYILPNPTHVF
jgi:hypothetical protein